MSNKIKKTRKYDYPPWLVVCPECGHQQADVGKYVCCEECGYGPMPTKEALEADHISSYPPRPKSAKKERGKK